MHIGLQSFFFLLFSFLSMHARGENFVIFYFALFLSKSMLTTVIIIRIIIF